MLDTGFTVDDLSLNSSVKRGTPVPNNTLTGSLSATNAVIFSVCLLPLNGPGQGDMTQYSHVHTQ